jgi:preprotein translocase subunit YajC
MLAIFVIFIAFFYFVAIRPQSKQRKAHQAMMNTLAKGDVVMLASGIYGKVKRVDDTVVVVEVAKGVTMKVVRRAIADIIRDSDKAKALAPEGGSAAGARGGRAAKSASTDEYEAGGEEEAAESDD